MYTEVYPGVYKSVLNDNTREQGVSSINIFLIPGRAGSRSLMIDTGFHNESCFTELMKMLKALNVKTEELDILLTHRHHDHSGLAGIFAERGARLFMNPEEERHPYDCLAYKPTDESEQAQKEVLLSVGVSRETSPHVYSMFESITERVKAHGEWVLAITAFPYHEIHAGEMLEYGDFHLRVVALRGHTYGQLGLVDEERRLFFVADQLISGVSPIVATTYPDEELLRSFFDSLENIKRTAVEGWTVLSAHGPVLAGGAGLRRAVDKSVFSYLEKCSKVKEILEEKIRQSGDVRLSGEMTVREVMEICYSVSIPENEEEFFKYKMTLTKTFSILEYLYNIGFVSRAYRAGTFYWKWIS